MATNRDYRLDDASGGKMRTQSPGTAWETFEQNCKTDPMDASDTIKAMNFPKGTVILAVLLELLVLEGGTLTLSVGDAGSATRYHNAVNMNTGTPNTVAAYVTPYAYTSDGYLLLTFSANAADLVKYRVHVLRTLPQVFGLNG